MATDETYDDLGEQTHQGKGGQLRPVSRTQLVTALTIAWTPHRERVGERCVPLKKVVSIGRTTETFGTPPHHENRAPLLDKQMSRRHAEVQRDGSALVLRDVGSTNGTYVNGRSVGRAGIELQHGDVVGIGDTLLLCHETPVVPAVDADIPEILGTSHAARALRSTIRQYARAPAPVLILGATGSGKELVAQALAELGRGTRGRPYLAFNVTATSEHLIDATLFGNERGAYTGADKARDGLFKSAHLGTLFLDEIGELGKEVQVKLLRALQEGEITPVGSVRPIKVDVRVVTATNRDLVACVRDGSFRSDLYGRLAKLTIRVPSLTERREDIPLLAYHLAERFAKHEVAFSTEALTRLMLHPWPLNVRELDGVVMQAVVDQGSSTEPIELSGELIKRLSEHAEAFAKDAAPRELDKDTVEAALRRTRGNMKRTAAELGKDRAYLYRVLKRFGLNPADYRTE